jgi:hypothetical protein
MDDLISHRLGTVRLEPASPVVAGSVGQWRLIYTAGSYGVDDGGTLKLSQRWSSDWEVPQFDRPADPAYTAVTTSGDARLRVSYSTKAHVRPYMKCLVIDVYDGYLVPGDTVTITLGDQTHGSPGIRAQTFVESNHEFRLLVDPTNACVVQRLPTSPTIPILPDRALTLACVLPSQALVGQPAPVFVWGVDRWGNSAPLPEGGATLTWKGSGEPRIEGDLVTFDGPATGYLVAEAGYLAARSNPIIAYATLPPLRKFWGDLHAQSGATIGTGTEDEYFTFARDQARLDFASHQGNDFQVTDEAWAWLNETSRRYHQDGRFVVMPGYEWSGNTATGGDRNVIYRREGFSILRSSHWQVPDTPEDALTPAHPADVLFARLREHAGPENVIVAAHVGGRYADIRHFFDPELCPLVEIVSCWGVFEWLLWDAFDMGYVVGVTCNSDGHKGRPGAEGPGLGEFGIANGLTCVLAPELTRDEVFDALRNRRCYGTTGPRIDLSFELDGQPMGSLIPWREKAQVRASVVGTAPLESLSLLCGREVIRQVRPADFRSLADSSRVRVSWRGSRIRGRGRRVTWDGAIRLNRAHILRADPFAFDAPSEGLVEQEPDRVAFLSRTTGDTDGVDLWLDQPRRGTLLFESRAGSCLVELERLDEAGGRGVFDLGGLGMEVCVERYPEELKDLAATLEWEVEPPPGQRTPYLVKAVQSDGHMAWSSPIYVGEPAA